MIPLSEEKQRAFTPMYELLKRIMSSGNINLNSVYYEEYNEIEKILNEDIQ